MFRQVTKAIRDGVDQISKSQDDQGWRIIIEWLTRIDYAPQQFDLISKCQKGTRAMGIRFRWIPDMAQWKEADIVLSRHARGGQDNDYIYYYHRVKVALRSHFVRWRQRRSPSRQTARRSRQLRVTERCGSGMRRRAPTSRRSKFDSIIQQLSFSIDGSCLHTNRGALGITTHGITATAPPFPTATPALFVKEQWIVRGSETLLWLPPDCRTETVAVFEDIVALRYASGRVSIIEFSQVRTEKSSGGPPPRPPPFHA